MDVVGYLLGTPVPYDYHDGWNTYSEIVNEGFPLTTPTTNQNQISAYKPGAGETSKINMLMHELQSFLSNVCIKRLTLEVRISGSDLSGWSKNCSPVAPCAASASAAAHASQQRIWDPSAIGSKTPQHFQVASVSQCEFNSLTDTNRIWTYLDHDYVNTGSHQRNTRFLPMTTGRKDADKSVVATYL